jgi:flavin-dependent thymidylate synthase
MIKVELQDYTGAGSHDPGKYAAMVLVQAKATRLSRADFERLQAKLLADDMLLTEELRYIANTIRTSWEFVDYTFQIDGVTRAFTHQFVRTRTGSYAQQTQRTIDMSGFGYSTGPSIEEDPEARAIYDNTMDYLNDRYCQLTARGIPPQDARGLLPTNIHTSILAKFNLRSLADLVGKRRSLRAQGEYAQVVELMVAEAKKVHPWVDLFLSPERTSTPALDKLLKDLLGNRAPF